MHWNYSASWWAFYSANEFFHHLWAPVSVFFILGLGTWAQLIPRQPLTQAMFLTLWASKAYAFWFLAKFRPSSARVCKIGSDLGTTRSHHCMFHTQAGSYASISSYCWLRSSCEPFAIYSSKLIDASEFHSSFTRWVNHESILRSQLWLSCVTISLCKIISSTMCWTCYFSNFALSETWLSHQVSKVTYKSAYATSSDV